MELFDFLATWDFSMIGHHDFDFDRIVISIVTSIKHYKKGIGMNNPEVFALHLKDLARVDR